jgi:hypothetical protein
MTFIYSLAYSILFNGVTDFIELKDEVSKCIIPPAKIFPKALILLALMACKSAVPAA